MRMPWCASKGAGTPWCTHVFRLERSRVCAASAAYATLLACTIGRAPLGTRVHLGCATMGALPQARCTRVCLV